MRRAGLIRPSRSGADARDAHGGAAMVPMEPDGPALIAQARGLAKRLLRKGSPERWLHTQGVATRAAELAVTVPAGDRPVVIAAARQPTPTRRLVPAGGG